MNLIFQYWNGVVPPQAYYSASRMKDYADQIGVEHVFYKNISFDMMDQDLGIYTPHFASLYPVFDESFDKYDNILFLDADMFPVDDITENIFDEFTGEIAAVAETFTSEPPYCFENPNWAKWKEVLENKYGGHIPLKENGDMQVLNGGTILYSKEARIKARNSWVSFKEYCDLMIDNGLHDFYASDQPYTQAMMYTKGFDVQLLDDKWNSQIVDFWKDGFRITDIRKPETNFVHVRLNKSEHLPDSLQDVIVHDPIDEWPEYLSRGQFNPMVKHNERISNRNKR